MTGWYCPMCYWLGSEPHRLKIQERSEFWGQITTYCDYQDQCPSCLNMDLQEVLLCELCLKSGTEVMATHDDYCREHAAEQGWDFDTLQEGNFRRDRRTA